MSRYIPYDESHPEESYHQNPLLNGVNNGNGQDSCIDSHLEDRLRAGLADFLSDPDQPAMPAEWIEWIPVDGNATPNNDLQLYNNMWMDIPSNDNIDYIDYGTTIKQNVSNDSEHEAEAQSQEGSRNGVAPHAEDESNISPEVTVRPSNQQLADDLSPPEKDIPVTVHDDEPAADATDAGNQFDQASPQEVDFAVLSRPWRAWRRGAARCPLQQFMQMEFGPDVEYWVPRQDDFDAWDGKVAKRYMDMLECMGVFLNWNDLDAYFPEDHMELTPPADVQRSISNDQQDEQSVSSDQDQSARQEIQPVQFNQNFAPEVESQEAFEGNDSAPADYDLEGSHADQNRSHRTQSGDAQVLNEVLVAPEIDVQHDAQHQPPSLPAEAITRTVEGVQPAVSVPESDIQMSQGQGLSAVEPLTYREMWPEREQILYWPHFAWDAGWAQHVSRLTAELEGVPVSFWLPRQQDFASWDAEDRRIFMERFQVLGIPIDWDNLDAYLHVELKQHDLAAVIDSELSGQESQQVGSGQSQQSMNNTDPRLTGQDAAPVGRRSQLSQDLAAGVQHQQSQGSQQPVHVTRRQDVQYGPQFGAMGQQQTVQDLADPENPIPGASFGVQGNSQGQVNQSGFGGPHALGLGGQQGHHIGGDPGDQFAQEPQEQEDEPPSRLQEWLTADIRPGVVRNERLLSESFATDLGRLVERFSTEQARANFLATHDLSWMPPDNDVTFPTTLDDQRRAVESLLFAMTSVSFAEDNENNNSSRTRWYPRAPGDPYYSKEKMVIRCWELVRIAMRLHRNGPSSLGCFDHEYAKLFRATSRWSFQTRIDRMAHLLATRKNRCDLVMKGESLDLLVGCPDKLVKNASSNTKNNRQKAELIQAGKGVVISNPPPAPAHQGQAAAAPQPQAQAPPPVANAQVRANRSAAMPRPSSQQAPTSARTLQGQGPTKKRKRHSGAESATPPLPAPKRARQMSLATMPSPGETRGQGSPSESREANLPVPSRGRGSRFEPNAEPIQPGFRSFSSSSSSRPSFGNGDSSSPFSNSQRPIDFSLLNTPWTPLEIGSLHHQVGANVAPIPGPNPHRMSSRPSMLPPTFPPNAYPQPHQLQQTTFHQQGVQLQSGQLQHVRPPQTRPQQEQSLSQQAHQHPGRQQGVNRQSTRQPAVQRQASQGTGLSAQGQAHGQPSVSRSASTLKRSAAEDLDGSPEKRARRE
ncbi:hypothetical protein E8E13_005649 [Curvularia kusanoi]|uniref:Uncharacterized protein n=1 Tax=Curvularia kusanoi TaxID=90978 RepID=A0A9P4W7J1_CURKU|nr:hypothetical protein E8E13_005649 [Curvularia kusanoi]